MAQLVPERRASGHLTALARRFLTQGLLYVLVSGLAILFVGPFFWAVSSSLKHPTELFIFPPKWLPAVPQWDNWVEVWRQVPFGRYALNSTFVTTIALIGQVASATVVAYGFARFRFPGRDVLFVLLLSTMILPGEVTLIPQFLLFRMLGWLDSFKPLTVPQYFGGGPFFIFLMRQFFLTIPLEMDESARLDGAGVLQILYHVLLPLCKPAIATISIFSFMFNWNAFFLPLIYLNSGERFTLPLGLRYFQLVAEVGGDPTTHLLMAASLMTAIPCVVIFFVMQRYFVQGIVLSGLKG